jgi:pimeloyl-ACP methyl ester carboxylesterase
MSQPILLIPGLNCTAEVYVGQVPALWQFGSFQIANHHRGTSMAEIAAAILADAPPRFALGGFSMGGYIAFEILRQAPERVTRLALIDTMARLDTPEGAQKRHDSIRLAEQGKHLLLAAQNFPFGVHPDSVSREDVRAITLRMAEQQGAALYIQHQRAILARPDSRPDLARIKVPTTVIVGEADQITPVDAAEEMAAGIAGARLVTIAGAGHMSPTEQPDAVTSALVEWLSWR